METQEQVRMSVGMEGDKLPSPELPVAPVLPLATETPTEPSVASGATGLAWWNAMKYEWRRSGAGNNYLAPQAAYVADVLDRAVTYKQMFESELNKDDFADFQELADAVIATIQLHDAHDTAGVEGHAVRRHYLTRLILATKICGASAVSSEHRCINEMSRATGDVEKMKADPEGYFQSDVSKRNQWGAKAVEYAFIVKAIADGEVIPTDANKLNELIVKRVSTGKGIGLGDEAYEIGRTLQRPTPAAATANKPSREELLALTA